MYSCEPSMLFVVFTCTPTHVAARFLAGVLEISVCVCVFVCRWHQYRKGMRSLRRSRNQNKILLREVLITHQETERRDRVFNTPASFRVLWDILPCSQ
jgi:hypothetical protein